MADIKTNISEMWSKVTSFFDDKFKALSNGKDVVNPDADIKYVLSKSVSLRGIIGLPPRFSKWADLPLIEVVSHGKETKLASEGRKYLETYAKWGSMVFVEVGYPQMLRGMHEGLMRAVINNFAGNNTVAQEAAADSSIPETVVFQPAGYDYGRQVNVLTSAFASFLDLTNIYGSEALSKTYKLPENAAFRSKTSGGREGMYDLSTFVDEIETKSKWSINSDVKDNKVYLANTLCLYTNGGIESPFNLNHQVGESALLGQITGNAANEQLAEIAFLDPSFDPRTSNIREKEGGQVVDNASFFDKVFMKLFKSYPVGMKLIAPHVYKGTEFVKSIEIPLIFQASSHEPINIFYHVLAPLANIMPIAFPVYHTEVAKTLSHKLGVYGAPFVVRVYSKGAINMNLGLVESITINKLAKDNTLRGLPTRIEVTLTIKDLYGVIGLSRYAERKDQIVNSAGLTEWMASMTGITMSNEVLKTRYLKSAAIDKLKYTFVDKPFNLVTRVENSIKVGVSSIYKTAVSKVWTKVIQ